MFAHSSLPVLVNSLEVCVELHVLELWQLLGTSCRCCNAIPLNPLVAHSITQFVPHRSDTHTPLTEPQHSLPCVKMAS